MARSTAKVDAFLNMHALEHGFSIAWPPIKVDLESVPLMHDAGRLVAVALLRAILDNVGAVVGDDHTPVYSDWNPETARMRAAHWFLTLMEAPCPSTE